MNAPTSRRPSRQVQNIATAVAVLIVTGLAAAQLLPSGESAVAAPAVSATTAVRTTTVRAVSAGPSAGEVVTASATLKADREAVLSFAVSGIVLRVLTDEGAIVREGEVLAELDPVPFQAGVDQAEARRGFLRSRVERSEGLRAANAISVEELEADRAELAALEAQLAQLRWNLARSRVVAPFAGRVKSRYVERGETVSPSQSAFAVIATGSLEARVAVPMRVLARLDLDAPLVVSFPDRPELARIGRVDHPPVASDERSGSVPLVIDVPNDDGALLPGMLVDVALAVGDPRAPATTELRVPLSAVRVRDEGPVVFRIDDETSTMVAVELGDVRGTEVVVLGGLHAGDVIVDQTPDRLRDGDVVAASR